MDVGRSSVWAWAPVIMHRSTATTAQIQVGFGHGSNEGINSPTRSCTHLETASPCLRTGCCSAPWAGCCASRPRCRRPPTLSARCATSAAPRGHAAPRPGAAAAPWLPPAAPGRQKQQVELSSPQRDNTTRPFSPKGQQAGRHGHRPWPRAQDGQEKCGDCAFERFTGCSGGLPGEYSALLRTAPRPATAPPLMHQPLAQCHPLTCCTTEPSAVSVASTASCSGMWQYQCSQAASRLPVLDVMSSSQCSSTAHRARRLGCRHEP